MKDIFIVQNVDDQGCVDVSVTRGLAPEGQVGGDRGGWMRE